MHEQHWQILAQQDLAIAVVGWAITAVVPDADEAAYAYTVGLTEVDAPELVITGLHHTVAHALLNDAAQRVHDHGHRWRHQQRISDLLAGYDAVIIDGTAHAPCGRCWRHLGGLATSTPTPCRREAPPMLRRRSSQPSISLTTGGRATTLCPEGRARATRGAGFR